MGASFPCEDEAGTLRRLKSWYDLGQDPRHDELRCIVHPGPRKSDPMSDAFGVEEMGRFNVKDGLATEIDLGPIGTALRSRVG